MMIVKFFSTERKLGESQQQQQEILEVQAQGNKRNSCLLLNKWQRSIRKENKKDSAKKTDTNISSLNMNLSGQQVRRPKTSVTEST